MTFQDFVKLNINNVDCQKGHIARIKHFGKVIKEDKAVALILKKKERSNCCANSYIKTIKLWGRYKGLDWTKNIKMLNEQHKEKIVLSNDQVRRLVDVQTYPQMDMFFKIFGYHPFRISELFWCNKNSLNYINHTLRVERSKTYTRTIKIVRHWDDLVNYVQRCESFLLFPSIRDSSKPPTQDFVNRDFTKRLKACEIEKRSGLTANSLRHSTITMALKKGAGLLSVMRLAGHRNANTTKRYDHPDDDDNGRELEKRFREIGQMSRMEVFRLIDDMVREVGIDLSDRFFYERSPNKIVLRAVEVDP